MPGLNGLSDGAEWMWDVWFLDCTWQLGPPARCARPELHSGSPIFLMVSFGVFVFENSDGDALSVPIVM